jgi:alkylation response protein AidB-like acyl-CoA dehydrogenase
MAIDLTLDPDQRLVQESAHGFFGRRWTPDDVRATEAGDLGYSPELWREMAELHWVGMALPEAYGGQGAGFLDLFPVYEEMGRFLVPGPHLDTAVVAAEVLLAVGTDAQRDRWLPAIARGEAVISLALMEPAGVFGPAGVEATATRRGETYVLDGTKLLVALAPSADALLTLVRTSDGGTTLLLVDPKAAGVGLERLPNIAGAALYAVTFSGVEVPAGDLVGVEGAGWDALLEPVTKGAVLQTAGIVGAARAVLEMTNQYAKDRHQFGNPIGRYQAVQYMVSDVLLDLHRTDLLARQAAFRIATGRPHAKEAAMAISFGKAACAHFHRQAHEVHAGVAFILEHDLTLYSRRAKYWEHNLGDARFWDEQVARTLGI